MDSHATVPLPLAAPKHTVSLVMLPIKHLRVQMGDGATFWGELMTPSEHAGKPLGLRHRTGYMIMVSGQVVNGQQVLWVCAVDASMFGKWPSRQRAVSGMENAYAYACVTLLL